jgi:hypothetical protein
MDFSPCILSGSSFSELSSVFQSDQQRQRYFNLKILSWKLKGHNRLVQKSQNGSFLISSLCLIELIAIEGIVFGLVELILLTFKDPLPASDQGR